jgi:hypothetical protein
MNRGAGAPYWPVIISRTCMGITLVVFPKKMNNASKNADTCNINQP